MSLFFSIIIPTRNRARLLEKTLSSWKSVKYPKKCYEIIVVNNDPEDKNTEATVLRTSSSMKNLKYATEHRQGASFARNTGAARAKYRHLIFIDDDILVKPTFLLGYEEAWLKYPTARILGGRIRSELVDGKQLTKSQLLLMQKYSWCFAHLDWIVHDTQMSFSDTAYSANLSYRRDGNEHDVFSTRLGVQIYLDDQLCAEDLELCLRAMLRSEQAILLASKKIEVRHQISVARFEQKYLSKRYFLAGIEMYLLERVLQEKFPDFQTFYRKKMKTLHGVKSLLLDKHERTMLLSYFMNGKYFV